jgi:hypothetical protein
MPNGQWCTLPARAAGAGGRRLARLGLLRRYLLALALPLLLLLLLCLLDLLCLLRLLGVLLPCLLLLGLLLPCLLLLGLLLRGPLDPPHRVLQQPKRVLPPGRLGPASSPHPGPPCVLPAVNGSASPAQPTEDHSLPGTLAITDGNEKLNIL